MSVRRPSRPVMATSSQGWCSRQRRSGNLPPTEYCHAQRERTSQSPVAFGSVWCSRVPNAALRRWPDRRKMEMDQTRNGRLAADASLEAGRSRVGSPRLWRPDSTGYCGGKQGPLITSTRRRSDLRASRSPMRSKQGREGIAWIAESPLMKALPKSLEKLPTCYPQLILGNSATEPRTLGRNSGTFVATPLSAT
jgi:hypothetical protein